MTIDETQHDLLSSEEIKTLKVARTIAGHIFLLCTISTYFNVTFTKMFCIVNNSLNN